MSHKLIYGTRNPSKITQVQDALKHMDIAVVGLGDVNIVVDEDGKTPEENARKKAVEYSKAIGKSVLSMDAALYFTGLKPEDQPGLFVRRIPDNSDANDTEILNYYKKLIASYGGMLEGYWEFSFALGNPDGSSEAFVTRTYRTFVSEADSNILPGYPLESLQIDPSTKKFITELSAEEQAASWQSTLGAPLVKFIKEYYDVENN